MRRAVAQVILPLIAALIAGSCSHIKLVKPAHPGGSQASIGSYRPDAVQFSYFVKGDRTEPARKALLDSFSAFGIQNVKESAKPEQERTTLVIYVLEKKDTTLRYFPWSLVTLATLGVVPFYAKQIQPVEIHVLDPGRERDKQIRIIRTEYVITEWLWLPFFFMPNQSDRDDESYGTGNGAAKIEYTGWRRIFDTVILEVLREQDRPAAI